VGPCGPRRCGGAAGGQREAVLDGELLVDREVVGVEGLCDSVGRQHDSMRGTRHEGKGLVHVGYGNGGDGHGWRRSAQCGEEESTVAQRAKLRGGVGCAESQRGISSSLIP
jgi:hypothetical protein